MSMPLQAGDALRGIDQVLTSATFNRDGSLLPVATQTTEYFFSAVFENVAVLIFKE